MSKYDIIEIIEPSPINANEAILVASGDMRLSANQTCWPTQASMEAKLINAFAAEGIKVIRGHEYDPVEKHGFISNQRMGMDVFSKIHPSSRIIVAESVWQYSYHVLAGLRDHRGPILTVANWDGEFPGLVGLLNLNGSLTKMGVPYSSIWSQDFNDEYFLKGIRQWIHEDWIVHDTSHVADLDPAKLPNKESELGRNLARRLLSRKAIIGVFDEGCMGMYNAIFDDELTNAAGIYKERLSQSALLAAMNSVSDREAMEAYTWLLDKGMTFELGVDDRTELTEKQVLLQLKMYIAAVRMAHNVGCDAIGIQYQLGLMEMAPASDLAEGLLNNADRPPVRHAKTGEILFPGKPLVHFNEVDEGAAIDGLVTNRIWSAMGFDPATTLHDIRYGEHYRGNGIDDFVWVYMISGAVPASHLTGGYSGAISKRQPAVFFHQGGGTLSGVCKPGSVVWSRIYQQDGRLHADMGRATSVALPAEETSRRLAMTNPEWPIMHLVLHGVTRDQMMARHKANHANVVYAPDENSANLALAAKAAMLDEMGIIVHLCGDVPFK